jgi:hypothetical protein
MFPGNAQKNGEKSRGVSVKADTLFVGTSLNSLVIHCFISLVMLLQLLSHFCFLVGLLLCVIRRGWPLQQAHFDQKNGAKSYRPCNPKSSFL